MSQPGSHHVLSADDYLRMSQVIASVLEATRSNASKACLFFAVAGSYLLSANHHRRATPVAGAAFYRVSNRSGFTLAYGRMNEAHRTVSSDEGAFHCWVECEGIAVDLMAPLFTEAVAQAGRPEHVPRRMFQRPLESMGRDPWSLREEGDFFVLPNRQLSLQLLQQFIHDDASSALVQLCQHWYTPSPGTLEELLDLGGGYGLGAISLKKFGLKGEW